MDNRLLGLEDNESILEYSENEKSNKNVWAEHIRSTGTFKRRNLWITIIDGEFQVKDREDTSTKTTAEIFWI